MASCAKEVIFDLAKQYLALPDDCLTSQESRTQVRFVLNRLKKMSRREIPDDVIDLAEAFRCRETINKYL